MTQRSQQRKDGDLEAAISVLEQVNVIDPKHKPARWLMDTLEDLNQYQIGRETRDEFYRQTRRSLMEVEQAKIPWQQQLRYPTDWAERTARPARHGSRQSAPTCPPPGTPANGPQDPRREAAACQPCFSMARSVDVGWCN